MGGNSHSEQVSVVVRRDSDADGVAEESDEPVPNATVTLSLIGPGVDAVNSGDTSNGKKSRGVFSTDWIPDLADGTYTADVTGLTHTGYSWNPDLDRMPEAQHTVSH